MRKLNFPSSTRSSRAALTVLSVLTSDSPHKKGHPSPREAALLRGRAGASRPSARSGSSNIQISTAHTTGTCHSHSNGPHWHCPIHSILAHLIM